MNFAYDHTTMRLDGGAYDHTYRVAGVHFHWGSDDLEGSEHMIQGKHYPLEVQRRPYMGVANRLILLKSLTEYQRYGLWLSI